MLLPLRSVLLPLEYISAYQKHSHIINVLLIEESHTTIKIGYLMVHLKKMETESE
jgi:hypothetical protein